MRNIRPRYSRGAVLYVPVLLAGVTLASAPVIAEETPAVEVSSEGAAPSTRLEVLPPGLEVGVSSIPDPLASEAEASDSGDHDPNAYGFGPMYPRLANVYLHGSVDPSRIPTLAQWDVLVLDSIWSSEDLARLRSLNPDIKLFFYVCAHCVAENPAPNDTWRRLNFEYARTNDLWWRNSDRSIASDWPGTRLLNVTDRAPIGPQGRWSAWVVRRIETLVASKPELNGVFLDNFWKSIGWQQGNQIQVDSDCNPSHNPNGCDGVADEPADLDVMWNTTLRGMAQDLRQRFDQLQETRGNDQPLMILSNGAADYFPYLNGTMYEHFPSQSTPADQGNPYGYNWNYEMRERPSGYLVAPFQRSPYGVQIINAAAEGTWDAPQRTPNFERHKRFTLASTLFGDGYYSLDGPASHGNTWWEPEFDGGGLGKGYLGYPRGPVHRVGQAPGMEMVQNGSFQIRMQPWNILPVRCTGNLTLDNINYHITPSAARIDVTNMQEGGSFKLYQTVPLFGGQPYTFRFWARASEPQEIQVHISSDRCAENRCMRDQKFSLTQAWQRYEVSFTTTAHTQAGLNIFVMNPGTVWIDDVSIKYGDTSIFRRDFENGIVLLNYTNSVQQVPLGATFYRLDVPGSNVWDGAAVNFETIPPSDARILLRSPRGAMQGERMKGQKPIFGKGLQLRNEPNPFRSWTGISFALEQETPVKLAVYDVAGRRVRQLLDERLPGAPQHAVEWNGLDDGGNAVVPGVYFYRLEMPGHTESRKTIRLAD